MAIRKIVKYIILGLVQGFTEPLPVSSSAHLVIASHYLGLQTDLNTEIWLHFCFLLGFGVVFPKRPLGMAKRFLDPSNTQKIFGPFLTS